MDMDMDMHVIYRGFLYFCLRLCTHLALEVSFMEFFMQFHAVPYKFQAVWQRSVIGQYPMAVHDSRAFDAGESSMAGVEVLVLYVDTNSVSSFPHSPPM